MSIVEWRHPVRLPEPYRSLYVVAIGALLTVQLLPDSPMVTLVAAIVGGVAGIVFLGVVLTRGIEPMLPRTWPESGFVLALLLALVLVTRVASQFSWTGRVIGVIVGVGLAVIAFHVAELLHHRSTSRRRSQD